MNAHSSEATSTTKRNKKSKIYRAIALTVAVLAGVYLVIRQKYPIINDISTNLNDPLPFFASKEESGIDPAATEYPSQFRDIQKKAYPLVVPFAVGGAPQFNYEKGLRIATEVMKWQIVARDSEKLRFQAVAVTPLMKFKDDIVVVFEGNEEQTIVNMRSRSRLGKGDFGANQKRILEFFNALSKN